MFNQFSKMTGRLAKMFGYASFELAPKLYKAGAAVGIIYFLLRIAVVHTMANTVWSGLLGAIWFNIIQDYRKCMYDAVEAAQRLEEGSADGTVKFSLEEWVSLRRLMFVRQFWMGLVLFDWVIFFVPPVRFSYIHIGDVALFLLSWSLYAATDSHPGGKKVSERVKAGARAVVEKVGSLAPQPAPIPVPVRN
ncbi:MAG TPA: hypothetical protein VJ742_13065 [Nitrososphaera sp.]|nr:hypothetical protein [Nitrososphaera sp.]